MKGHPKIVFVGGGSPHWIKELGRDLFLTSALSEATYVLFDLDLIGAEANGIFLRKLSRALGIGAAVEVSDRVGSLEGADYILITISTGGFESMAFDLSIPEAFGIYHTVGDTSGPGGWARTIRNVGAFLDLTRAIRKMAPSAVVLNYTNPMTTLTDLLARELENPVIGLCHGIFENIELLKHRYGVEDESEISIRYAGLNHFFWCDRIKVRGTEVLDEFRESGSSLIDLLRSDYSDGTGFTSERHVAAELFELTGLMPYMGDRHTCEFFPQFITDLEVMGRYQLKRTTISRRRQLHEEYREQRQRMIEGVIEPAFLKRSRESAADIINAHLTNRPFIDVGNVPNIGQISNLPIGTVVETAVRVDGNGFAPVCFGALPGSVLGFVEPVAMAYRMTLDACLQGNRAMALQGLRHDPVCSSLQTFEVQEMGSRLLDAHRSWIRCF